MVPVVNNDYVKNNKDFIVAWVSEQAEKFRMNGEDGERIMEILNDLYKSFEITRDMIARKPNEVLADVDFKTKTSKDYLMDVFSGVLMS